MLTAAISSAVAFFTGGFMSWAVTRHGVSNAISTIQTDINTVKDDVTALKAKLPVA